MAAKAIVALLVLGSVPALAQSPPGFAWPQHPTLTWDDLKGRTAKVNVEPKRTARLLLARNDSQLGIVTGAYPMYTPVRWAMAPLPV